MYSEERIRGKYRELTRLLIEKHKTITSMESATSGQIASLITDTEGASAVMKGAFITYSNEAKIMMGVSAGTIERYSVYSEETAKEMAVISKEKFHADYGIGVTGTMGNQDPANPESSVPGQVYFAIAVPDGVRAFYRELPVMASRLQYKLTVAEEVVDVLTEIIKNA